MKRLFYEVRLYDYSTKEEALKHKEAMTDRTKKVGGQSEPTFITTAQMLDRIR